MRIARQFTLHITRVDDACGVFVASSRDVSISLVMHQIGEGLRLT